MRLLAVGAHPDDVECYCGGTVAACAARGDQAFMAVCTDGRLGHVQLAPDDLARLRAREAAQAAAILGAQLSLVGLPDGDLWADAPARDKLAGAFAWARPDLVVTHVPDDYHPDHRACSELVASLCDLAGVPLLYMDTEAALGFAPEAWVDLTETVATKLAALACHRSQVEWLLDHDGVDLLAWVRSTAATRGLQCGVAYAEAFAVAPRWRAYRPQRWLP